MSQPQMQPYGAYPPPDTPHRADWRYANQPLPRQQYPVQSVTPDHRSADDLQEARAHLDRLFSGLAASAARGGWNGFAPHTPSSAAPLAESHAGVLPLPEDFRRAHLARVQGLGLTGDFGAFTAGQVCGAFQQFGHLPLDRVSMADESLYCSGPDLHQCQAQYTQQEHLQASEYLNQHHWSVLANPAGASGLSTPARFTQHSDVNRQSNWQIAAMPQYCATYADERPDQLLSGSLPSDTSSSDAHTVSQNCGQNVGAGRPLWLTEQTLPYHSTYACDADVNGQLSEAQSVALRGHGQREHTCEPAGAQRYGWIPAQVAAHSEPAEDVHGTSTARMQVPMHDEFEYHDHPSFKKPPHRTTAAGPVKTTAVMAVPPLTELSEPALGVIEPQVIAEGASAIPPPPPIEKSAYPLAGFATEMVWEAFLAAADRNSLSKSSAASALRKSGVGQRIAIQNLVHMDSTDGCNTDRGTLLSDQRQSRSGGRSNISPASHKGAGNDASRGLRTSQPSFGAIGRERKPRLSSGNGSPNSEMSSPDSSVPGTPSMDGFLGWLDPKGNTAVQDGAAAAGKWSITDDERYSFGKPSLPEFGSHFARRAITAASTQPHCQYGGSGFQATASLPPPRALFEQVQKLLSATLLSQQVLLLGLYYITKTPHTSALFPPATSQSALRSTSAPFKLLLAALVVANKHLDDNSFRNSTFATVSDVTLPEVNALEYSMLAALKFDINVEQEGWISWLHELEARAHSVAPYPMTSNGSSSYDRLVASNAIAALIRTAIDRQREHPFPQQSEGVVRSAFSAMKTTPVLSPALSSSTEATVTFPRSRYCKTSTPARPSTMASVASLDANVPFDKTDYASQYQAFAGINTSVDHHADVTAWQEDRSRAGYISGFPLPSFAAANGTSQAAGFAEWAPYANYAMAHKHAAAGAYGGSLPYGGVSEDHYANAQRFPFVDACGRVLVSA